MGRNDDQFAPTVNFSGSVLSITHKNSETGFAILRVKGDKDAVVPYADKKGCITVLGPLAEVGCGQRLSVTGKLTAHAKYGPQVKVEHFQLLEPTGITEIVAYLTHNVKWVGEHYAKKIVAEFGLDTLRVLDETPDKLYDIKGINKQRAEGIKEAWKDLRSVRELLMFATAVGIGHSYVAKIHKCYGAAAIRVIRQDPYRLARDIEGIGFKKADEIAQRMGVPEISDIRVQAACLFLLEEHANMLGNCFVYRGDLLNEATEFLENPQITYEYVEQVVAQAAANKVIIDDEGRLYAPALYQAEVDVASRLGRLLRAAVPASLRGQPLQAALHQALTSTGLELHPVQVEAVERTMSSKVSVITGGPGVGKTTVTRAVVAGYRAAGETILLLAPTGKAAKRMGEVIGHRASTVHRHLYSLGKQVKDGLSEPDEVLIRGVVIVDESSMVDLKLFRWLLQFLHESAVLVMVGDEDQLPSVGPGSILRDLIASPRVATTKLTQIFRQAAGSDIIRHAHAINGGITPPICKLNRELVAARGWPKTDFYLIESDDQERMAAIAEWCVTAMAVRLGFDPKREVQVLTPMRKMAAGVVELNKRLQSALNPEPEDHIKRWDESVWGVGDRIMQLKNNYQYPLFNGDQGQITGFKHDDAGDVTHMTCDFEGQVVDIERADFNEQTLAYASTVHKSQGSEYPMVVMVLHKAHYQLLQRNLLYTGITRSRKVVVLIADPSALSRAIANNKVARRNTYLMERLEAGATARAA